jgi:hypothetical protein
LWFGSNSGVSQTRGFGAAAPAASAAEKYTAAVRDTKHGLERQGTTMCIDRHDSSPTWALRNQPTPLS